jgi:RNA polymerase subunit RPABC4/transcription elongation factor Spt4
MMKCPRCVQSIHRAAELCPHCGFSIADADFVYGGDEVSLRPLTDGAGMFGQDQRERIEVAMERMSRRFPQLFVAVYTGSLGEVANIRQFGFWLLNRAAFEGVPADKPNESGILITIDPESKAAAMTFGYTLDAVLEESDTFECLSRAHGYWLEGRYAEGLVKLLAHLEGILIKRCRQARRDPAQFRRKIMPPTSSRDGLKRMRDGHVPAKEEKLANAIES